MSVLGRPSLECCRLWLGAGWLLCSIACATAPPPVASPAPPVAAAAPAALVSPPPTVAPEAGAGSPHKHGQRGLSFGVRDGTSGAPVAADRLIARLAAARAIYVGEHHNDALSHHAQLFVLAEVYRLAEDGHDVAVGLEMLPRRLQPQLDAYLAGAVDEQGFLAAVDWSRTWGFDFALYRPLFDFCRTHGLRMYALNAPRDLPRAVRQKGLAGLTSAEQALLPSGAPWPMPDPHRRFVRAIFDQHPADPKADPALREAAFDRFYTAQLVWDESMAQAVADILRPGPENPRPPRRLVVLAGVGHVGPYAMPARAQRRGVPDALTFAPLLDEKEPPAAAADPEHTDLQIVLSAHQGRGHAPQG
ncbi:MAG: hypothetical protein E6Q99_10225 [Elusimicrobia bacterium]|nr:MAG: hypothetical protein E6Q99_10225 [Elusimicrobiota bacterium]